MRKSLIAVVALAAMAAAGCSATPVATVTQVVTSAVTVTADPVTQAETVAGPTVTETSVTTQPVEVTTTARTTVVHTVPTTVRRTVTVTSQPKGATADNGDYLVGTDIAAGTWQCRESSATTYWETDDRAGNILANDIGSIALVSASAYTVKLSDCDVPWKHVG